MTNPSGIIPTEFNVLVKPFSVEEKTKGGIILSDETKDRKQAFAVKGELIAVSPLAFSYEHWPEGSEKPQIGQTVIMTKAAGVSVEGEDGETYRLIKDKDIAAIVDNRSAKLVELDRDIREAVNG